MTCAPGCDFDHHHPPKNTSTGQPTSAATILRGPVPPPAACDACGGVIGSPEVFEGPYDPFLAGEVGLVLHRTIRIPADDVLWRTVVMNSNDRAIAHPAVRAKRTRFWLRRAQAAAANVPTVDWARIVVYYRFPNNIRRDVGNLQPTSKAIVDGLVKAGVLPDDNDKHVLGPDNRREAVNGPHQVIVRLFVRPAGGIA